MLSDSPHPDVRCELTICTYLPDEVIIKPAADPDRRVRPHVVVRPEEVVVPPHGPKVVRYVPEEAYAILSRSEDPSIQREHDPDTELAAAVDPPRQPTPDELRRQLDDPLPEVRAAAARHPDLPPELMYDLWRQARTPPD